MSQLPATPGEGAARVTKRRAWLLALLTALAWLAVSLPLLGSYGATWDCASGEYPYGERLLGYLTSGNPEFLDLSSYEPRPRVREPHPDFDTIRFEWFEVYPLGALLSALSCRLLWTELGVVPAMQAHNLVIPLAVAALLALLVRFAAPRVGALAAVSGAVLLAAAPRFFAHAFFNLKDAPEACLYFAATAFGYVALTGGALRWWIGAGVLTGLALAQKANALFVPPQLALFLLLVVLFPRLRRAGTVRWSWSGFGWGALAVVLAYYLVSPHYWTDPIGGPAARLGLVADMSERALREGEGTWKWKTFSAPLFVATTTPPAILLLAPIGLLSRRISHTLRLFLLAALLVTLGRSVALRISNFGGVRHFLEFYPYLCLAAGIGLASLVRCVAAWMPRAARPAARVVVVAAVLAGPVWQTARAHPNSLAYFNVLVGGLKGAQELGIPGATDYWGNSYWQSFAWLNENAEPDAVVLVPVVTHVARCIAPVRLRSDLELRSDPPAKGERPLYVTYITREQRYPPLVHELEARLRPVHEIRVQGGAVLRTFRLEPGPLYEEMRATWSRTLESRSAGSRIRSWLEEHPEVERQAKAALLQARKNGIEATRRTLRSLLPPELHEEAEAVIEERFERLRPPAKQRDERE